MSPEDTPARTAPAKSVDGAEGQGDAVECPDCHATSVGDVPFCGSCGYDFVTGVSARPEPAGAEDDGETEPRPTELQAAQPHDAYIDPRRDADDIELPTTVEDLGLDEADLERRPDVPPPTPPTAEQEHVAHVTAETLPPSRRESAEWVAEIWVDHAWAATRDSDQPVPDAGLPTVLPLTGSTVVLGRTNLERGLRPDLDTGTDAGVSVRHAQLTTDGHRWWVEDLDTSNGTYVSTVGLPLPERPIERGMRILLDEDDRIYLGGWTRVMLRRTG